MKSNIQLKYSNYVAFSHFHGYAVNNPGLIQKDPECGTKLYMKTLYYLEEYVGNFVASHRNDFRVDIVQAQRTQAVLEYMVSQGSHIAFFIREEI